MWPLLQLLYKGIDQELHRAPAVRPMTRDVIRNLLLDTPLSLPQCTDFGVETADHYRALRRALDAGLEQTDLVTLARELDQALGDGPALTAWVQRYVPESTVVFATVWDTLTWESEPT